MKDAKITPMTQTTCDQTLPKISVKLETKTNAIPTVVKKTYIEIRGETLNFAFSSCSTKLRTKFS